MSVSLLTYDKDMCPFLGTLYNFINLHCISLYRDTLYLYFSNSNPLKTTLKDRFRSNITSGDLEFSALQEEADYNRASNMINYMQELHMQLEPSFCAALYIQLYIRCSKAGATSTMGNAWGTQPMTSGLKAHQYSSSPSGGGGTPSSSSGTANPSSVW